MSQHFIFFTSIIQNFENFLRKKSGGKNLGEEKNLGEKNFGRKNLGEGKNLGEKNFENFLRKKFG